MDWVYMLECGDGSLYTGWTNDLARRLAAHQSGRGAKYTRGRAPVRLVLWLYLGKAGRRSAAGSRCQGTAAGAQAGASAAMGNGGKSNGCCDGFTGSAQAYGGRPALSAGG